MIKVNLEVLRGFFTTLYKPLAIAIESTGDCNAHCTMCSHDQGKRNSLVFELETFKKIIIDAKRHKIKIFQLSYFGESLLDPFLYDRISLIKEQIPDALIQIVTNGILLTDEMSEKLLNAGMFEIRISIEGNNKEEFEKIRLGLSFDEIVKNISNLKRQRDEGQFKTQIVVTGLHLEDYPLNENKYKAFWGKYADTVYIRNEHKLDFQKKETFLSKIFPCHQLFIILPIMSDLNVSICTYDWHGKQVYGNMNKLNIIGAWFHPKFSLYRILHLLGLKKLIPFCRNCSYKSNYKKLLLN